MTTNKSSRTLINLIGIPSLLLIIIVGDNYHQLPIFSLFIGVVLFLGIREIPIFLQNVNARPFVFILYVFVSLLQINRYPLIAWNLSEIHLLVSLVLVSMIVEIFRKKETPLINISSVIFVFIWLGVMLGSLAILRNLEIVGFSITLALFLSVWICDTAAFGFGVKFGKRKILPSVSPNKTWVGTIAGLLSSIIFMISLYNYSFFPPIISFIDILVLSLICGIFGQLGDFVESLLKREAKIKDSSNFLRGHGGILDRFDSLSFAAPLTVMYCHYFITIG